MDGTGGIKAGGVVCDGSGAGGTGRLAFRPGMGGPWRVGVCVLSDGSGVSAGLVFLGSAGGGTGCGSFTTGVAGISSCAGSDVSRFRGGAGCATGAVAVGASGGLGVVSGFGMSGDSDWGVAMEGSGVLSPDADPAGSKDGRDGIAGSDGSDGAGLESAGAGVTGGCVFGVAGCCSIVGTEGDAGDSGGVGAADVFPGASGFAGFKTGDVVCTVTGCGVTGGVVFSVETGSSSFEVVLACFADGIFWYLGVSRSMVCVSAGSGPGVAMGLLAEFSKGCSGT